MAENMNDSCPEGWEMIGLTCVMFFNEKASFSEAQKACEYYNANLIEPDDENSNSLLLKAAKSRNLDCTWIGIHDSKGNAEFMYSSDETSIECDNWKFGPQMSGQKMQQCAVAYTMNNGQWTHEKCENNFHEYICQKYLDL